MEERDERTANQGIGLQSERVPGVATAAIVAVDVVDIQTDVANVAGPTPTREPLPVVVPGPPSGEPVLDVGEPPTPSITATSTTPEPEEPLGGTLTVALTFYVCANAPPGQSYCGTMSSGAVVYEGAAACGEALSLGTQFSIVGEGRTYTCEDRGRGGAYWIDIFHYDYYAGRAWRDDWPQSVEIEVYQ